MALRFVRAQRVDTGFTAAMTFLAARAPFRTMPLGGVADSVRGAVQRGHYILAVDEGRVVGVTCWGLTDAETARRWTAGEVVPDQELLMQGDTVVLMLGGGDSPAVALRGVRHIAGLYPGRAYRMVRHGRQGVQVGRFPGSAALDFTASGVRHPTR